MVIKLIFFEKPGEIVNIEREREREEAKFQNVHEEGLFLASFGPTHKVY